MQNSSIDGSYIGMIDTLNGNIAARIRPHEHGPVYLVRSAESTGEFGAAWKRTSRKRKLYLSVSLEPPEAGRTTYSSTH